MTHVLCILIQPTYWEFRASWTHHHSTLHLENIAEKLNVTNIHTAATKKNHNILSNMIISSDRKCTLVALIWYSSWNTLIRNIPTYVHKMALMIIGNNHIRKILDISLKLGKCFVIFVQQYFINTLLSVIEHHPKTSEKRVSIKNSSVVFPWKRGGGWRAVLCFN